MSVRAMVGPQLSIRGEQGGSVSIDVRGYERPDTGDFWDSNWLQCTVDVKVQGFRATIGTSLRTDDFVKFYSELTAIAEPKAGEARFRTMEGTLSLVIQMRRQGTCTVRGNVRDNTQGSLDFNFDSDHQTFLWETVKALEAIAREFPIRNADKGTRG
jgi:hypothetical protein